MKAKLHVPPLYVEVLGENGPEGVAEGQSFVDDFTGEVVKVEKTSVGAARRGLSPEEWKVWKAKEKLKAQREMLEAVGIMPRSAPIEPKLVAPRVEGKRVVRVVKLGGEAHALHVPMPAWRRF